MEREIISGQIYKHFKNKFYQIVTVARHSETKEMLVIYQQLYGDFEVYARPLDMFMSEVDHEKYPEVKQKYRFELVKKKSVCNIILDENKSEQISDEEITLYRDKKINDFIEESCEVDNNIVNNIISENEFEKVNPYLLMFLDAETFEEKRNVLIQAKNDIDNRLIDDIAVSLDVTIDEGELEERFKSLLLCLDTFSRYEVNRFR